MEKDKETDLRPIVRDSIIDMYSYCIQGEAIKYIKIDKAIEVLKVVLEDLFKYQRIEIYASDEE